VTSSSTLARFKTVVHRGPRYATMFPSPSGGVASLPPSPCGGRAATEKGANLSSARVPRSGGSGRENFELGHSKITSRTVKEMESLGYFHTGCGRVVGAKTLPRPDGERLVFEGLFTASLRLSSHDFLIKVLKKFKVQLHQLTPNVVVALSKFIWATTTFGGGPSIEAFAEHYCLHWQKRSSGGGVDQFGRCTFTMKPGKTKEKVIELAPYAKNMCGWKKIWFYVCCSRGKGWPLASTLSVFQVEAFPHNAPMDSKGKAPALTYEAVDGDYEAACRDSRIDDLFCSHKL
jgi:hypothetical protein